MASLIRYAPAEICNVNESYIYSFYEASSQTFKYGDLVTISSGKVAIAKAAGNNLGSGDKLLGMALEDASGTAGTAGNEANKIKVFVFTVSIPLRLPVYHATAASAITAIADIGNPFELRNHTGSIWCIDVGSNTNNKGIVIDIPDTVAAPVGTQYGRYDYMLDKSKLLFT